MILQAMTWSAADVDIRAAFQMFRIQFAFSQPT
jgi:hypothetical protein